MFPEWLIQTWFFMSDLFKRFKSIGSSWRFGSQSVQLSLGSATTAATTTRTTTRLWNWRILLHAVFSQVRINPVFVVKYSCKGLSSHRSCKKVTNWTCHKLNKVCHIVLVSEYSIFCLDNSLIFISTVCQGLWPG